MTRLVKFECNFEELQNKMRKIQALISNFLRTYNWFGPSKRECVPVGKLRLCILMLSCTCIYSMINKSLNAAYINYTNACSSSQENQLYFPLNRSIFKCCRRKTAIREIFKCCRPMCLLHHQSAQTKLSN